ncbi:MAG: hypothetical protein NZ872_03085 [Archaeoglobaceae archaeon]|nr:hypothetical protein [Archaeoglobaceae archaeon]MDW8128182.1 hypothetical protein [Archaeoglobaceae archaeon]
MSSNDFRARVRKQTEKLREIEGACGICHGTLEAITEEKGTVLAYEKPDGVLAVIKDDEGNVIGKGFDIVWSPAILSAEIDAKLIPERFEDKLKEALSNEEEIKAIANLYGYGRVVTPSVVALQYINEIGGRTVIKRERIGVVARLYDKNDRLIAQSSVSYCPTCAIVKAIVKNDEIAKVVKERLKNARNTGKIKFEEGVENRYEASGGAVRASILKGDKILANRVIGCCIAYSTTKAEITAGFVSQESAKRFKAYCNLCPMKHCWMEKSMGAMGNIVLHRLSEIGMEIEVTSEGFIVAKIPGEGIIGRGTLCTLSALTNMLITSNGSKLLKPSPAKRFPEVDEGESF